MNVTISTNEERHASRKGSVQSLYLDELIAIATSVAEDCKERTISDPEVKPIQLSSAWSRAPKAFRQDFVFTCVKGEYHLPGGRMVMRLKEQS